MSPNLHTQKNIDDQNKKFGTKFKPDFSSFENDTSKLEQTPSEDIKNILHEDSVKTTKGAENTMKELSTEGSPQEQIQTQTHFRNGLRYYNFRSGRLLSAKIAADELADKISDRTKELENIKELRGIAMGLRRAKLKGGNLKDGIRHWGAKEKKGFYRILKSAGRPSIIKKQTDKITADLKNAHTYFKTTNLEELQKKVTGIWKEKADISAKAPQTISKVDKENGQMTKKEFYGYAGAGAALGVGTISTLGVPSAFVGAKLATTAYVGSKLGAKAAPLAKKSTWRQTWDAVFKPDLDGHFAEVFAEKITEKNQIETALLKMSVDSERRVGKNPGQDARKDFFEKHDFAVDSVREKVLVLNEDGSTAKEVPFSITPDGFLEFGTGTKNTSLYAALHPKTKEAPTYEKQKAHTHVQEPSKTASTEKTPSSVANTTPEDIQPIESLTETDRDFLKGIITTIDNDNVWVNDSYEFSIDSKHTLNENGLQENTIVFQNKLYDKLIKKSVGIKKQGTNFGYEIKGKLYPVFEINKEESTKQNKTVYSLNKNFIESMNESMTEDKRKITEKIKNTH